MPELLRPFSGINTFLIFFTKKLRLSNPWNFKVPFLICIPYLVFLVSDAKNDALEGILASISVIIGVAGFGYLTNDLGDKHKDHLIGKENAAAKLSTGGIVFLFVLFLAMAIAPWFYLPMNRIGFCLLSLQFLLFYMYAFPPFRLKERGFLGVMADAGYAHVNPALLAAYTFYLYTGKTASEFHVFIFLLALWQFVLGIRNILFHQLKDHSKDLESGTNTFVTDIGLDRIHTLLKKILLPLETILFIAFAIFITRYLYFFIPVILVYWIFMLFQQRKNGKVFGFREYAYLYLDDLYIKWIPLIVLVGLVINSINFLPVLILHVLIFRNEVKTFFINRITRLR